MNDNELFSVPTSTDPLTAARNELERAEHELREHGDTPDGRRRVENARAAVLREERARLGR